MKANPDKFQAIYIGKRIMARSSLFKLAKQISNVMLGINIDYMLKFDAHVSEICKKKNI